MRKPEYYTISEFELIEYHVKKVTARRLAGLRMAASNGCKRKLFKLCVKELCAQGVSKKAAMNILRDLEMHHIVPLSIGGGNSLDNLALVEKRLHRKIHWHLAHAMRDGIVLVPTHSGRIWIKFPRRPIDLRLNGEHFGCIP